MTGKPEDMLLVFRLITSLSTSHEIQYPSLSYLLALLDFSHYLQIDTARTYALHFLPLHPDFMASPTLQFACSRKYSVPEWVGPSFRRLLGEPLEDITLAQATDIGMEWFLKLHHTMAEIDMFRLNTAYSAPEHVDSFSCTNPFEQCKRAWELAWWLCYGKHLLHPDEPKSCEGALREMETGFIRGMCADCKTRTIQSARATNMFGSVETLVIEAIGDLTRLVYLSLET